jgi:hypothetical protein
MFLADAHSAEPEELPVLDISLEIQSVVRDASPNHWEQIARGPCRIRSDAACTMGVDRSGCAHPLAAWF